MDITERPWVKDDGAGKPSFGPIDKAKRDEVLKYCEKLRNGFEKKCLRCKPSKRSCETLEKNIQNLTDEIQDRFKAQEQGFSDWNDPKGSYRGYCPPGTNNYNNHTTKIENAQTNLQQRMKDHEAMGCDKKKLAKNAKEQMEKKVRFREGWRAPRTGIKGLGSYVRGGRE